MNNELLEVLKESFHLYITGGARSNQKLKPLHGKIATDFEKILNSLDNHKSNIYRCFSLNAQNGKEKVIKGRYIDKVVDITVQKNDKIIAGISVEFVMSNFKQNKNNYFENMLGETANIRSNNYSYYQIFITPDVMPYYTYSGIIKKWEKISVDDLHKYIVLSSDNSNKFFHTPDKIYLGLIHLPIPNVKLYSDYQKYFEKNFNFNISYSKLDFPLDKCGNILIYNDYEEFVNKVSHHILSL
ncbi:hypothetical protein [Mycoplasmopsis primatum]|uniref:hypothetical protein n=1 Tax=Mycoplasmopsis primatum TaxID=55604 RepID=UPI00068F094C|nr:hypothetical protein [Mycoplasmopsis primatum]